MVILSGSGNQQLADKVARQLKAPLLKRLLDRFPNQEIRVRLEESVVGQIVVIIQGLQEPVHENLMELLLLADAARHSAARIVMAVVPWMAYSKQDKVFLPGEPLSARVLAKIISGSSVKRLYTVDLHNPGIQGFFEIPTYHISLQKDFAQKLKRKLDPKTIVVAPDFGGIKRSGELANFLNLPLAYLDKTRDRRTGKVAYHQCNLPVSGRPCLMFDDMISTGSTAIQAARYLSSLRASEITFCAVHGLFSQGFKPFIKSRLKQIYLSDTVPLPPGAPANIEVISAAPAIAAAIRKTVYQK